MSFFKRIAVLSLLLLAAWALAGCGGEGESAGEGPSGTLQIDGSTTVAPVAQAWAEQFHEANPGVDVIVNATGSGDGIAALINGTTDIAMASREMKDEEAALIKSGGPMKHVVGRDALAVITNPSNPVKSLTLEQLKGIFTGDISNWKEIGGNNADIIVYTRDTSSGTYTFFKEFVLKNAEYAASARKTASNAAMVESVAQDEAAIGYCGLAYLSGGVNAVAVSEDGTSFVEPSIETAQAGQYPIVRDLIMYTVGEPQGLTKDFLDFGLGSEGQDVVKQVGYLPVK